MLRHIDLKRLSSYLDGRIRTKEKELVGTHLTACKACREKFASLEIAKNAVGKFTELKESDGFDFEFRQRLNRELAKIGKRPAYREKIDEIINTLRSLPQSPVPVLLRGAAVITLTAFFMVFVLWNQMNALPAIASIDGEAAVYSSRDNEWQSAREGRRIRSGDILKVAGNSRVNIESKRYEIMLKENTEIKAIDPERAFRRSGNISYGLTKGKMLVATKRGFKNSTLKVDSPLAGIKAKSTGFMVDLSPQDGERAWVGVLDGKVEVESKIVLAGLPSKVVVESGKATEIRPNSAPTSPRYLLEREWEEVQEIYRIGEQPQVALLVSMTPRRVHELLKPAALYVSDKKAKAASRELVKIVTQVNEAIIKGDKKRHLDAIGNLERLIAKHPDQKYNAQFMLFIAAYYYYVDEYERSILTLDRFIKECPGSTLTSLALCAKGLIYERGLRDSANAATSYRTVLKDYPESLEAEEARSGIDRLVAE
ncbi:MAG: tetratricopeptide repeat protein [Candidatus Omnitrophica bacterium]|nr:tetratricopeptide repeat protein [Candidatus Omnitrophota bacterium]